ncbi:MAG TPA: hypothetical protein VIN40_04075 [Candidatus Tyrphobacter sp.]
MILVVAATPQEVAFLEPRSGVERLVTGIGPVEAAAQLSRALARCRCDLVVNAGIAGAYDREAEIGEGVVVAEDTVALDLETGAPLVLPAGLGVHDRVASDSTIVEILAARGFRSVRGVTVTRVTATDRTAARLRESGAQVESMEGFAVLRAAQIAGIRAIELRGISNYAGDRSCSHWNFTAGTKGLERIVTALLASQSVTT